MRSRLCCLVAVCLAVILAGSIPARSQNGQSVNSISGFVLDARSNQPVSDVYVELLNDVYSTLKRIKTDGSGRYSFHGISSGNFKVRVLPYNTNYLEDSQDVQIMNFRSGNTVVSDSAYVDFHLKLDKRKINVYEVERTGTIYVQDIPAAARTLYRKGVSQLSDAKDYAAGIESLKKAIELFPDYYEALDRLGSEYVSKKEFYEALPYLVRAITVNNRSYSSYYMLGLAAYNLKQLKEATEAFRAATIINASSVPAQLQYGMVLRIAGSHKDAETALLKALSLAKDSPAGLIHWQLALLYDKLGRYAEAAAHLEKYLKDQPDVQNTDQIKELIAQMKVKAAKPVN